MAVALACAPALAAAQENARTLSVAEYRDELRGIEASLAQGDLPAAAAAGEALRSARVAFEQEQVPVDPALVGAVAAVRADTRHGAGLRVRAVLRGLEARPQKAGAPDLAALRRAQRAEAPGAIPEGGEVGASLPEPTLPERFRDAIASLWRSLGDAWDRFVEWLKKFWPRREMGMPAVGGAGMSWTVGVLVAAVALVMALLAVAALRRSAPPESASSEPVPSSQRDADPLSREQDEWEKYAAELAAAGRMREAIRAWYHAVLVGLFRAGLLHHHKGRTNWEYVSRVAPEADWRPALITLTRLFDREWYGRDRSGPEALRECAGEARGILRRVREGAPA
jgi:hypothetical protein